LELIKGIRYSVIELKLNIQIIIGGTFMLKELNERLGQVQVKLRERDKLSGRLTSTIASLDTENVRMDVLRNKLAEEKADVDKLQGLGLTALFYTILGSKEEQLEIERQELLTATLKFEEAKSAIEALQLESAQLVAELGEYDDLESEFHEILEAKIKFIKENNYPQGKELLELTELESSITSYQKEIKEAIQAGQETISALESAAQDLQSAENWGTWDMLGGGLISTAVKHSRIDSAQNSINLAQQKLRTFQRELADIEGQKDGVFDIDGLTKFADYFFDNLITDWIVQRKITDSLDQTNNQLKEITSIIEALEADSAKSVEKLAEVKAKRVKLVELVH
jgi:hypothetical protein